MARPRPRPRPRAGPRPRPAAAAAAARPRLRARAAAAGGGGGCLFDRPSALGGGGPVQVVRLPASLGPPLGGAHGLVLDASGNIHSVYFPAPAAAEQPLSDSYWDVLGAAAALGRSPDDENGHAAAEPRRVGLAGLAAGTCAFAARRAMGGRPLRVRGWELDGTVVEAARAAMGLGELERDGSLEVTVGDALVDPPPAEAGGLDVVLVDVFTDGALLPELRRPGPWRALLARLEEKEGLLVANLSGGEDPHQAQATEALQAARRERGWGLWVKELGRVRDCVSANRLAVAAANEPDFGRWRADLSAAGFDAPGRALTAAVVASDWRDWSRAK